jgi:hypothetical protein
VNRKALEKNGREATLHSLQFVRSELPGRFRSNVWSAGKIGVRVKIFRVDGSLPKDAMADLCTTFFMWNDDVKQYFAGSG